MRDHELCMTCDFSSGGKGIIFREDYLELLGFTDLKSENQIHLRVLIRILEISPFSIILVFISADLSTLSWIMPKAS